MRREQRRVRVSEILERLECGVDGLPPGHPDRQRPTEPAWGLRRSLARDTPSLAAVRAMLDKAEIVAQPTDVA